MKFYIASKFENYRNVQKLSKLLTDFGWKHSYDWTAHGSIKETDIDTLKAVAQKELDGVREADILIVLTPQGRGTHVELGIAAGQNKSIYISHADNKYFMCNDDTSAFYWLPNVTHFVGSPEELAEKLLADNPAHK